MRPVTTANVVQMRLFLSEYVTGGAWPEPHLESSLAAEGRGMLAALAEDCLRIPAVEVVTTQDVRAGSWRLRHPRLTVHAIQSPDQERAVFETLCQQADRVVVIAPEFHGLLEQRVQTASRFASVVNCSPAAIALCADKLQLTQHLHEQHIACIPTEPFNPLAPDWRYPLPLVIKPRDGAGSTLTFLVRDAGAAAQVVDVLRADRGGFEFIQQPFVPGLAVSISALVSSQGTAQILPAGEQLLSDQGRFEFLGTSHPGRITAAMQLSLEALVRRCLAAIPGLRGWVGFDVVLIRDDNAMQSDGVSPVLCEINPRLTTSYLALRRRCGSNLAAAMLELEHQPLTWHDQPVMFRVSDLPADA